ncbi:MAG TPA: glycosyltransferase family 2 protein [Bacillota bacterium]
MKAPPLGERIPLWGAFMLIVAAIVVVKVWTLLELDDTALFGAYSVLVSTYILSRFLLAAFYEPERLRPSGEGQAFEPAVTIIVPAKNEEEVIGETLRRCLQADYPPHQLQVIAVNDGSTDRTLTEMRRVEEEYPQLTIVDLPVSQGKRRAMAEGVRRARGEVLVFIDSDSLIEPGSLRKLVAYFADPTVGAVTGHADVYNKHTNLLTRMQAVRYYIAFRVYKAAEALYGSVTCCSGCFSAYRRRAVEEVLEPWLDQTFLGVECTYGDDRSLTNYLLPNWRLLYAPEAQAYTVVPDTWSKFLRQQLRWKKSWVRESLRAAAFMWRKPPVMALSFYIGALLPLLAPLIVLRAVVVRPLLAGVPPYWYLGGVLVMAFLYGLYYRIHKRESLWVYGTLFALFYTAVLVWQMPYAILTMQNNSWGTR